MTYKVILDNFKNNWNLKQQGEPIETASSVITFVEQNGVSNVLKIFNKHSDEYLSATILNHYNTNGAIKVIQQAEKGILLERAAPGIHLKDLSITGKDEKATHVFCYIVKKLHSNKPIPKKDFPTIAYWGKWFDRYLNSNDMQIPKSLVYETKQIFFELTESQGKTLLLHGDLHHDNILFDKKRGWLAIDPKGIIGEAEIEVSAFLKNPVEHPKLYANEETIRNRVNIVVQTLNLNRERILLWCYTLTMIHSMWLIETKGSPKNWVDMAQLLKRII